MKDNTSSAVQSETRRLAAIMFTDIVGFSHQMGSNEARTLRLLDTHNQLIRKSVTEHHGTVIKTVGDAFLVDFPSVVHAVQCAQEIQAQLRAYNAEHEPAEQIHVRIGIHLGDIVQKEGDVFGDGVNIAKRLQELAEPDTICLSDVVYRDVAKKLDVGTVMSLGRPKLKHIAEQLQVYVLVPAQPSGFFQHLRAQRLKLTHWRRPLQVAVALLVLGWAGVVTHRILFLSPAPGQPQRGAPTDSQPLPFPDKPSIVVLPFVNLSNDPEQEYFSDGITEDITSDLSRIASLFVIARNSAFTYKGKAVKVQDVSREMGVRYVLEGSVRKSDNQVRITAQLIDATTGEHLWAERYDRPLKDIFALQGEIVQKIVTTLKLQLTLMEQGYLVHKTTDNLEAYDAYLRGRESSGRFTKEANAEARQLFERAVALDQAYAEAYARLGYTYYIEWGWQWSQDPQALERAGMLAQQALALDDLLPIAHSLLSIVHARKQQYDQAITEGERAIALDPNNAESYAQQSNALNFAGKPEEALRSIEQAIRFSPHYPPLYLFWLSWAYQLTGRYAEAIVAYKQVLVRNPNFLAAHLNLAISYVLRWGSQLSQNPQILEQALAAAQRAIALNDASFQSHGILGFVYLWQKQYEHAIAAMEWAVVLGSNDAISYAVLADGLSRIGRYEDALRATEQALRLRSSAMVEWHLLGVGTAYDLARKPEEAVAPLKQYLTHYPNILGAHLTLAAVYSELGKEVEARAEAAEVLRINPKFSLEVHKERVPIKDPTVLERQLAALRKAGLK